MVAITMIARLIRILKVIGLMMNPLQSADYAERNFATKKHKEQNKAGQNSFVPLVPFCGFIFRL